VAGLDAELGWDVKITIEDRMSDYNGIKYDGWVESEKIIFTPIKPNLFDGVYRYVTAEHHSGSKSIMVERGGCYEFLCGIGSTGSKTVVAYAKSSILGKARIELWSPDGLTRLGSAVNDAVDSWDQLQITYNFTAVGNYRVRLVNSSSNFDLINGGCIVFFDDVTLT